MGSMFIITTPPNRRVPNFAKVDEMTQPLLGQNLKLYNEYF